MGDDPMHPLDILENLIAQRGPQRFGVRFHAEATRSSFPPPALSAIRPAAKAPRRSPRRPAGSTGTIPSSATFCPETSARQRGWSGPRSPSPTARSARSLIPRRLASWPALPAVSGAVQDRARSRRRCHPVRGSVGERPTRDGSNAAEHADSELSPIASYEVAQTGWSFSVTDVGVGSWQASEGTPRSPPSPTMSPLCAWRCAMASPPPGRRAAGTGSPPSSAHW